MAEGCVMGSRIKLVSKAQIRYEGMLSKVDPVANTVTLDDVRMFGTEGRSVTGPQIPLSNQVYRQIVFKGSDISQLSVIKPQAKPLQDPAIVSCTEPTHPAKPQMTMPNLPRSTVGGMFDNFGSSDRYGGYNGGGGGGGGAPAYGGGKGGFDSGKGGGGGGFDGGKRGGDYWHPPSTRGGWGGGISGGGGGGGGGGGYGGWGGGKGDRHFGGGGGGGKGSGKRGFGGHHQVGRRGGYGGKGSRGGMKGRDGHTGMNFKSTSEDVASGNRQKLVSDFDFDDVAAESAKMSVEKAAAEPEEPKPSYNKTNSFFDTLNEGADGQRLSQKERQRHHDEDIATFGRDAVSGVERSFHRNRRGPGRGRW